MEVYKHSGGAGIAGVPLATCLGSLTAVVLGTVYVFLVVYIPLIYVNFFVTLGYGAAIGLAVGWAAKVGKIRNTLICGSVAGMCGLLGLYVAWAADPLARGFGFVVIEPQGLIEYMKEVYANGTWGMSENENVTGMLLAAVWLVEAGIILATAVLVAAGQIGDQPFCEACDRWTTTESSVQRLRVTEEQAPLIEQLISGDLSTLGEFARATDSDAAVLQLDLATCPGCEASNFMTVRSLVHTVDKDNKLQTATTDLLQNLIVTPAETVAIRQAGRDVPVDEDAADDISDDAADDQLKDDIE